MSVKSVGAQDAQAVVVELSYTRANTCGETSASWLTWKGGAWSLQPPQTEFSSATPQSVSQTDATYTFADRGLTVKQEQIIDSSSVFRLRFTAQQGTTTGSVVCQATSTGITCAP